MIFGMKGVPAAELSRYIIRTAIFQGRTTPITVIKIKMIQRFGQLSSAIRLNHDWASPDLPARPDLSVAVEILLEAGLD